MANSEPLVPFGIALLVILGLFIAIPYIRGKSDIPTAWNALLVGLIIFVALASIEVNSVPSLPGHLEWFQPNIQEIRWYMIANGMFVATLLVAYYINTPAKRFAQKRFQTWPELSAPLTFFVIGICFLMILASTFLRGVPFFGPLVFSLAYTGAPAACVFSFALWSRNRVNFAWLFLFLGVFACMAIYAMIVSAGRRMLLSMVLGPVLYVYWTQVRYWRPTRAILVMAAAMGAILFLSAAYSTFRWYNFTEREQRTASGVIRQMRDIGSRGNVFRMFLGNRLGYLSQNTGQFALLAERYVAQRDLVPAPLNTVLFLVSYPVPRYLWPGKPEIIGVTITREVARVGTTWGVGIAGHGAYEGGVPALMIYAVLLAFLVRFLDEPLQLQPSNPFLIYIHVGALPNLVGVPRGDMGFMVKEIAQAILCAYLLGFICRFFFGSRKSSSPLPPNQASLQHAYSP